MLQEIFKECKTENKVFNYAKSSDMRINEAKQGIRKYNNVEHWNKEICAKKLLKRSKEGRGVHKRVAALGLRRSEPQTWKQLRATQKEKDHKITTHITEHIHQYNSFMALLRLQPQQYTTSRKKCSHEMLLDEEPNSKKWPLGV